MKKSNLEAYRTTPELRARVKKCMKLAKVKSKSDFVRMALHWECEIFEMKEKIRLEEKK